MISKEEMRTMTAGGRSLTLEDFIAYYEMLVSIDKTCHNLDYVLSFTSEVNVKRLAEEHRQLLALLKELHDHREFLNWLENHILPNEWEQYQNQYKNRFDYRKSEA